MLEPNDPDKARGLYHKFTVERVDPEAQARHAECDYFVLDLKHDPLALQAIEVYAYAAHKAGYGPLSDDLIRKIIKIRAQRS